MSSSLGFPSNPTLNQQFTIGTKNFIWDGTVWNAVVSGGGATLTQEEVQDYIAPLFNHANHTNVTVSYDDNANKIILTAPSGSQLSQEELQDYIAPLFNHSNHTNVTATYDDANNKILLSASGGGGGGETDIALIIGLS